MRRPVDLRSGLLERLEGEPGYALEARCKREGPGRQGLALTHGLRDGRGRRAADGGRGGGLNIASGSRRLKQAANTGEP